MSTAKHTSPRGSKPASRVSRHDRRKHETRSRILAAAAELFGEQGYDATKVVEICDRADVARQTFFNHFTSKIGLLHEINEAGFDFLRVLVDNALARGGSTRERIALLFEGVVAAALGAGPMMREFLTASIQAVEHSKGQAQLRLLEELFASVVLRGLEDGDVTQRYPVDVLTSLAVGAYTSLIFDWATHADFEPAARATQMAAIVADALERRPDE